MSATFSGGQLAAVFLVMLRCAGLVVAAPIFGHRAIPAPVKAGLVVALTVALVRPAMAAPGALPVAIAAPIEIAIGLTIGFILSLGFEAIELSGRMIALQMGLSLGEVLNPTSQEAGTPIDPLFSILAGLLFLALGLHLAVIDTLARSFQTFPIGGGWPADLWLAGARTTSLILELGVRVALPITLVLLLTELAIALLNRAIPQINVFILGLPVKMLVGFAVIGVAMPTLVNGAESIFQFVFQAANGSVKL